METDFILLSGRNLAVLQGKETWYGLTGKKMARAFYNIKDFPEV